MNKNSTDQDSGKDLPGYPHYPPAEDIMNPENGLEKVGTDVEDLANSKRLSSLTSKDHHINTADAVDDPEDEDDLEIVEGTDADVTSDDLLILGDEDSDPDLGEDELQSGKARVDKLDEDEELDIPGSELDDPDEIIGEEDEENNYYSLGGDRHDELEEDPS